MDFTQEDLVKVVDNLTDYIKDYVEFSGSRGVVLGASGGVDSSTLIPLAIRALGLENVYLLMLPCGSEAQDLEHACMVADQFGAAHKVIDLEETYRALAKHITEPKTLTLANIKARLRMTTLYAFANQFNYLNMGTGNKSELMIGYVTKYGDHGVDVEPLGGLYKGEVVQVARELEIPECIIQKPPSAGLWKGQTDMDELGFESYDELDKILDLLEHSSKKHILDNLDVFDIMVTRKQLDSKKAAKVVDLVRKSVHKRTMPPCFSRNFLMSVLAK